LGDIALHTHDYAQAEGHYRDALAFQQTINNRFGVFIITTSNLVTLACAQDQYDEAGRLIEQARKIGVELGMSAVHQVEILFATGRLNIDRNRGARFSRNCWFWNRISRRL
jgi:hypothetical protein